MGEKIFYEDCPYKDSHTYSHDKTAELIKGLLSLGTSNAYISLGEDTATKEIVGVFGAMRTFITVSQEPTAVEVLWWVDKVARNTRLSLKLIKAYEYWANLIGVKRLVIASMSNEHSGSVDRLYTKMGYRLAEKTYVKKVI